MSVPGHCVKLLESANQSSKQDRRRTAHGSSFAFAASSSETQTLQLCAQEFGNHRIKG